MRLCGGHPKERPCRGGAESGRGAEQRSIPACGFCEESPSLRLSVGVVCVARIGEAVCVVVSRGPT